MREVGDKVGPHSLQASQVGDVLEMKEGAISAQVNASQSEYPPEVGRLHLPGSGAALEDFPGPTLDLGGTGERDQAVGQGRVVEGLQGGRRGFDHPQVTVNPEP